MTEKILPFRVAAWITASPIRFLKLAINRKHHKSPEEAAGNAFRAPKLCRIGKKPTRSDFEMSQLRAYSGWESPACKSSETFRQPIPAKRTNKTMKRGETFQKPLLSSSRDLVSKIEKKFSNKRQFYERRKNPKAYIIKSGIESSITKSDSDRTVSRIKLHH